MTDNIFPLFPGVQTPSTEPDTLELQQKLTDNVVQLFTEYNHLISTLGGIIRRQDVEGSIGHPISDEEYTVIASVLSSIASHYLQPILPLIVRDAHERYTEAAQ